MNLHDQAVFDAAMQKSFAYYHYAPSLAAAVLFTIFFILTTSAHLFQIIGNKTWFFVPLLIGGIFEILGYVGRAIGARQTPYWTLGPYLLQALGLLLAPALFAASIYMTLGRIIRVVDGEVQSPIRRTWLTKIFVFGDVLSFLTQSGGGSLMAGKKPDQIKTGQHIIVAGLFIQLAFFGIFMLATVIFHIRIQKVPTAKSADLYLPWMRHIRVIYAASVLIMIRSIMRVIEYIAGNTGYILRHEAFLYVFDGCLMLAVVVLYNIVHPSEITVSYRQRITAARDDMVLEDK